jgi:hypothetical protein
MKLISLRISEIKTLNFMGENTRQTAEITIKFINDEGLKKTGFWKFISCKFNTISNPYNLKDWEFISAINDKIKELIN